MAPRNRDALGTSLFIGIGIRRHIGIHRNRDAPPHCIHRNRDTPMNIEKSVVPSSYSWASSTTFNNTICFFKFIYNLRTIRTKEQKLGKINTLRLPMLQEI